MKNLEFHATQEQRLALEGLMYWHADLNYFYERYPDDAIEIEGIHKNMHLALDGLDRLKVPFWVQNAVLAWSEEWRNIKREYLSSAMEKKNIFLWPRV